jgi:hypothetical protein
VPLALAIYADLTWSDLAAVHRDLALLRRVLNVAAGERWIAESPFRGKASRISADDERKHERMLTRAEEDRLLAPSFGGTTQEFVITSDLTTPQIQSTYGLSCGSQVCRRVLRAICRRNSTYYEDSLDK